MARRVYYGYRRGADWANYRRKSYATAGDPASERRAMERAVKIIECVGEPGYGYDSAWLALVREEAGKLRVVSEYQQGSWSNPLIAAGLASTPIPRRNERPC